jgi:two-component sensor histidine kinase
LNGQLDSLISLLENSNDRPELINEIHDQFSQIYYQNPPFSLINAIKTDSLAKAKNYNNKLDLTHLDLGIAYNVNESYDSAAIVLLKAVDFAEMNNNAKIQAQAYNNLAVVWQVRKDTKTTAEYFEKALELYEFLDDSLWIGIIKLNLGGLYMEDEMLDQAEPYFEDVISIMEKMGQPIYAGYGKLNQGSLRVKQKRYTEAISLLQNALTSVPFAVNPLIHAVGNTALGESYMRMNQFSKAENFLDEGYRISKEIGQYEQLETVSALKAEFSERLGNYPAALDYLKESYTLRDSFISQEEDQRLVDAIKKYESEKKEQEIKLLSAENEVKDLTIQRNNRNLLMALLALIAAIIIAFQMLKNRNKFKFLNEELKSQKAIISQNLADKELLLKEIHHRVKNNLQVISSLLNLQADYIKDDSAIQALNEGKNRVKSMALIHQNLYQEGHLANVELKSYFTKLCSSLFDSYNVDKEKIKLKLNIEEIDLDVDHVIPLGLIANELISNSLKHAFHNIEKGEVSISLNKNNDTINLIVKDSGKGFDFEKVREKMDSFGHQMIDAFLQKANGTIQYSDSEGCEIKVQIPDES